MIDREKLEEFLDDNAKDPYKTKGIDHDFRAIELLRKKIPYKTCKSIISSAEHDVIYLVDVDIAIQFLTEEDAEILADCNCFIDSGSDRISLFV